MEITQDEQNQRGSTCSSGDGGNGGRSSKRVKQKKIPQRGLGVAQLEKIRLKEQQQKKDSSNVNYSSSPSSPITPSSESLTNFHPNQSSSSSLVPFSPRPLIDVISDHSLFKQPPITSPSIDKFSTIPLANQINGGTSSYAMGWPPLQGHADAPNLWSSEQGQVGENQRVDHHLAFRPNFSLETNHIYSRPNVMLTNHNYPPQSCPPMVNVSTATSSSSVPSFQMEPPSNQSYYGNYSHLRQEEEKMVGVQLPYLCPLEIPPCPSFHCQFLPFDGPINRLDEATPCDNGSTRCFYPSSKIFREIPSCSTFVSKPYPRDKIENGVLRGDFLTLAPPTSASLCTSAATFKHKSAYSSSCNRSLFEFELLPYKGFRHQQPSGMFLPMQSFLPPAKAANIQARTQWNNVNEARDNIDLNLKL